MKNFIDKSLFITYRVVLIVSIICLSIALIGATFFCVNRSFNYLNPLVLIMGTIIFLFLLIKLYKTITKLSEKKIKIICFALLATQFILLFISTRLIRSVPQVDLIHMLTGINSLKEVGTLVNSEYFSVYPNNKFLLMILYCISKLPNNNIITYIFSCCCITIMSLFTYKSVKKISDSKKALVSLFICVFSPIFYLYASYYYTDVLMLPLASILIYLVIKNKDEKKDRKTFVLNVLIGILAAVGYKIRAVSIFILIAYFVFLIIKKEFKHLLKTIFPILIVFAIALTCINKIENKFFIDLEKDKEFPMTHWIMMGVNSKKNGYYSQDDYNLSFNTANIEERKNLNIKTIGERIKKQGIIGNTSLIAKKIVTVWGKGDYSYQKYLGLVEDYNKTYNYLIEDKNVVINYILQIFQISILILSIIALIHLYKENKKSIMAIAVFGAIFFYLIWEVCPRYGLSFLPWLILLGTYSYNIIESIPKKMYSYPKIRYIILILTILILGVGFYKYTSISYKESVVAKSTSKKIEYIELNNKVEIKQSVNLRNEFNKLKLRFKIKDDSENENVYVLELIDSLDNVKYKKEFTAEDVKDDKYTTFKLDRNYEKGIYYIKLSTKSKGALDAALSYKEYFDFYSKGDFFVNDKLKDGDLMFEIINKEKRNTYSYFEYMILVAIIMYLEYVLFFRKKEL